MANSPERKRKLCGRSTEKEKVLSVQCLTAVTFTRLQAAERLRNLLRSVAAPSGLRRHGRGYAPVICAFLRLDLTPIRAIFHRGDVISFAH